MNTPGRCCDCREIKEIPTATWTDEGRPGPDRPWTLLNICEDCKPARIAKGETLEGTKTNFGQLGQAMRHAVNTEYDVWGHRIFRGI